MKQLFCLLLPFFILISCENSDQIKEIEILTYFNNARDFKIYSNTDKKGFTQTLYKSETSEYVDNYQSQISKSLMDSIIKICKNSNDENFIFKRPKGMWYCGDWHSIRVTYENGEKLIFKYPFANDVNKQFITFQSLFEYIRNDSLNATRLNIGQLSNLYTKQEDLSNLTFKRDSIFIVNYLKKEK